MQHSSTRTLAILSLAGAIALTGCGSSSKSKTGGLGGAATSAAAGASRGRLAVVATVKIGFEGPLTRATTSSSASTRSTPSSSPSTRPTQNNTYGFQVTLVKSDDVG